VAFPIFERHYNFCHSEPERLAPQFGARPPLAALLRACPERSEWEESLKRLFQMILSDREQTEDVEFFKKLLVKKPLLLRHKINKLSPVLFLSLAKKTHDLPNLSLTCRVCMPSLKI